MTAIARSRPTTGGAPGGGVRSPGKDGVERPSLWETVESSAAAAVTRPMIRLRPGAGAAPRPASPRASAGRVVRGPVREAHEPDHALLVSVVALAALGILMIYSSYADVVGGAQGGVFEVIVPELLWAGLGVTVMLVLSRTDYRWLRLVSVPGYIVALVLLGIVLLPKLIGVDHFGPLAVISRGPGSYRWLTLEPLGQMHPAELAKLALVVYLAHWLARRGKTIASLAHGFLPFLVIAGLLIALVALEPDLGTTVVFSLTAVLMLYMAGGRLVHFLLLVPAGVAALVLYVSSHGYQLDRWRTFIASDPFADCMNEGYQVCQGLYALAIGGVFGDGLGQSRQPGGLNLPAAENDFIFAMIGQELGLVGGVAVMGLLLFLAYRGTRIAMHAADTFGGLLAAGITAWLTIQAFINIGVVVNLLPVTGIPLPFVSSGGTSLVVSFAAVGILLSISRETQPRGTIDDADPGRGRGDGRSHLPGPGRPAQPARPSR